MAINPSTQYPGKVATPNPDYPYGGAQNITTPGDGTGTPWEAALVNDIFGFQQSLLFSSGIVPSGTPEKSGVSQYFQSIVEMISGRTFNYTVLGTANAIILNVKSGQQVPGSLFDGFTSRFKATATNTGATTANVAAKGVKTVKNLSGNPLTGGEIRSGNQYDLIYNGVDYVLIPLANNNRVLLGKKSASASSTIEFINALDNPFYQYDLYYHNASPSLTSVIFQMDLSDDSGGSWDANIATLSTTMGTPSVVDGKVKMQGPSESRGTSILGEQSTAGIRGDISGVSPFTKTYDSLRVKFNSGNIATGEFFLYGINQR